MSDLTTTVTIVLLLVNLVGLIMVGVRINYQMVDARGMEKRLNKLEANVEHLPTHHDLHELQRNFNVVAESVASVGGKVETMTQLLKTIQEYLLEKESRR